MIMHKLMWWFRVILRKKSLITKMIQIQKKTKSCSLKQKWKIKNNSSKLRIMKQSVAIQDHSCRFLQASIQNWTF